MRAFKVRDFARWAADTGLTDAGLLPALQEVSAGLGVIALGIGLLKKRVALAGRGRRGGCRLLLAYQGGLLIEVTTGEDEHS